MVPLLSLPDELIGEIVLFLGAQAATARTVSQRWRDISDAHGSLAWTRDQIMVDWDAFTQAVCLGLRLPLDSELPVSSLYGIGLALPRMYLRAVSAGEFEVVECCADELCPVTLRQKTLTAGMPGVYGGHVVGKSPDCVRYKAPYWVKFQWARGRFKGQGLSVYFTREEVAAHYTAGRASIAAMGALPE
jgi:hypothetical protein